MLLGGVKVVTVERWRKKGKEVSDGSDESVEWRKYVYIYMDNGRKILELDGKCEMWYNMMMEMVEKDRKQWRW